MSKWGCSKRVQGLFKACSRLVEGLLSRLFKAAQGVFKACSRLFKACSGLFKAVQGVFKACSRLSKACSRLFKAVQGCSRLFKVVQGCSRLFKVCSRFVQGHLRAKRGAWDSHCAHDKSQPAQSDVHSSRPQNACSRTNLTPPLTPPLTGPKTCSRQKLATKNMFKGKKLAQKHVQGRNGQEKTCSREKWATPLAAPHSMLKGGSGGMHPPITPTRAAPFPPPSATHT